MKGIKGRILNRLRTIPSSIYSTKQQQHIVAQCPNYSYTEQQQEHRTRNDQEWESGGSASRELNTSRHENNGTGGGHINGSHDKLLIINKQEQPLECNISSAALLQVEDEDVFEECETGTDDLEFDPPLPLPKTNLTSPPPPLPPNNINTTTITTNKKANVVEESQYLLNCFEEKCPPGSGKETIILYTTSLRGIRKTFEDCHAIKFLLDSYKVIYYERDVSMHLEFRNELWKTLDGNRVIPPRLFIKGKYIGGADEVIKLNEQGKLKILLQGLSLAITNSSDSSNKDIRCSGCGDVRFVVCLGCNGSRKVYKGLVGNGNKGIRMFSRCVKCNENGLIKCPTCSSTC